MRLEHHAAAARLRRIAESRGWNMERYDTLVGHNINPAERILRAAALLRFPDPEGIVIDPVGFLRSNQPRD